MSPKIKGLPPSIPPGVGQSTQASLWSSSHSDIWRTPIPTMLPG